MSPLLAAAPDVAPAMSTGAAIGWATVLLLLSAALAVTEFLVVSWGMLLVASAISALAAIALAFQVSSVAGWGFLVATVVIGLVSVRSGMGLLRRNRAAVITAEVTADAGYRHAADAAGVGVGTIGELVTQAVPSGRARFPGRNGPVELDIRVQGPVLAPGDRVVVLAIDGPTITVGEARDNVSGLMTNTNP